MHIIPSSLLSCYNDGKGGDNLRLISKFLGIIGVILVAPIAITLIWQNWSAALGVSNPIFIQFDWWTRYGPVYLFWSGIVLAVMLILLFLIFLFWPRSRTLYLHQKADEQVTVTKKAIEHFASSALQQESFIGNPKVTAKLGRNSIKLNISGDLLNSVNAKQHTANFLNQLKSDLRDCLGISKKKKIKIKLADFNASDANKKQSRVV